MKRRLVPHVSLCRWWGTTGDDHSDAHGWSLAIEWLGIALEFCWGRLRDEDYL